VFFPQEGAALGLTCETPAPPPMGKTPTHKSAEIKELCAMYALRQNVNERYCMRMGINAPSRRVGVVLLRPLTGRTAKP